ncbi:histidine kinase N-terminal 7TM domain-containing protein [Halostella sp. PRR32]|uniref:histidine kinase N-terminal 7TM domain-containing protein n=1 Tax=Halostella sp. PRR32 TaxID=3098147 RepID=UPI002B1D0FD0|nr:histidine kinase N-terminal 7TM domain-containing protein [Halostella sp. PRR32]
MSTTAGLTAVFMLAAVTGVAVARVSHRRDAPMADGLTVSALGIAGTSIDAVFELLVPTVAFHLAAEALSVVTSGLIIVGWVYFIAHFTNYERVVDGRRIYLLAAPFLVIGAAFGVEGTYSLLAGAQSASPLIVDDPEPWYSAFDVYGYGLSLLSLAALIVRAAERNRLYRRQAGMLVAALLPPLLVNQAGNAGIVESAAELTPIGFALTGLITLYALYYHDLLEIVPIARETTINTIEDGVIALNNDEVVATVNDAAKEMFDVTDDVLGKTVSNGFSEWPDLVEAVERSEETTAELNDGRFVTVSLPPIRKRGIRIGTLVHLRDVTEEVEKQREIAEKTERLERQNEYLDEFAGVVSHDIRNPLSIAQGYTEEVARQVDDDEAIRKIRRSHERIETIVDDLLTLARRGRQVDDAESVAVKPVAEAAARTAGVPDGSLAVEDIETLWADPTRLQELFENLFQNSVEHGSTTSKTLTGDSVERGSTSNWTETGDSVEDKVGDGHDRDAETTEVGRDDRDRGRGPDRKGYPNAADGGKYGGYTPRHGNRSDRASRRTRGCDVTADDLTVRVGRLDGQEGFYVEDDGPGIPESERSQVLERGYTNARGGTGLGLSIVKSIAEAHDWKLRIAESEAGGARFEFLAGGDSDGISSAEFTEESG